MTLALPDGQAVSLHLTQPEVVIAPPKPDKVKDYARLVLELGTQFFLLLRICKTASWDKMLPLLKVLLLTLKANNEQAKYALELLRFLVIQYSLLSEKDAAQMFDQLFVNTKGLADSHVPCDLVMEWQVRDQKKHLKHMFSNKTEANILARSTALGGLEKIGKNYDDVIGVRARAKRHNKLSALCDERLLIEDLRGLRPFRHNPGRAHRQFPQVKPTITDLFNGAKFHQWFHKHKNVFNP